MLRKNSTFIIVLIFISFSCKELYDYDVETTGDYLVVEGMITDDPGPYFVTLIKAAPYSNDIRISEYTSESETGATVIIRSDKGEEVVLTEEKDSLGTYATKAEDIRGEAGHSYWISIQTNDGEIYESLPSGLLAKPDVPNLYAEPGWETVLDESTPGYYVFDVKNGLQLSCDLDKKNGVDFNKIDFRTFSPLLTLIDSVFYRDFTDYFLEEFPDSLVTVQRVVYRKTSKRFCWIVGTTDAAPNILGTGNTRSGELLKNIPVSFVPVNEPFGDMFGPCGLFEHPCIRLPEGFTFRDNNNNEISADWLYTVTKQLFIHYYYYADLHAYAINETVYEYYRNLQNQSVANNRIFDPVPVELVGNLHCTSNPGKSVFGVFITASVQKLQFSVYWQGGSLEAVVEKLEEYFPFQVDGCMDEEPVFWGNY